MYVHPQFSGHKRQDWTCIKSGLVLYSVQSSPLFQPADEWEIYEGDDISTVKHDTEDFYYAFPRKTQQVNDQDGKAVPLNTAIILKSELDYYFKRRIATLTDNHKSSRGARKNNHP